MADTCSLSWSQLFEELALVPFAWTDKAQELQMMNKEYTTDGISLKHTIRFHIFSIFVH